ncbi:MAG: SUMF1/EgtB/PvdO family nonheme iron enzyme, partial [Gammaproteobacteria bacterium]
PELSVKSEPAQQPVAPATASTASVPTAAVSPPSASARGEKSNKSAIISALAGLLLIGVAAFFFFYGKTDPVPPVATNSGEVSQPAVQRESIEQPQRVEAAETESTAPSFIKDPLKIGGQGPQMVELAGGVFTQGSSSLSTAFEERPDREVTVPPFAISVTEVTFNEYGLFVKAVGGRLPDDQGWGRGERPVINVSWDDARAYAAWLSSQTGHRYRLPSESEWEYAARAGTSSAYWWGRKPGKNRANCWGCGSEWDGVKTAPVSSFAANPWGLRDTSGNVLEWVADCMHKNYKGAPVDGSAWQQSGCTERVVRGGSWSNPADGSRVAKRVGIRADVRQDNLGFRLVRELE